MKPLVLVFIVGLFVVAANAQQRYSELSGHVTIANQPVRGVTLTIGGYGLVSDGNGYYRFGFLRPGVVMVRVTPPNKQTRMIKVMIAEQPTTKNIAIDW